MVVMRAVRSMPLWVPRLAVVMMMMSPLISQRSWVHVRHNQLRSIFRSLSVVSPVTVLGSSGLVQLFPGLAVVPVQPAAGLWGGGVQGRHSIAVRGDVVSVPLAVVMLSAGGNKNMGFWVSSLLSCCLNCEV